jgi:hypothetical protein
MTINAPSTIFRYFTPVAVVVAIVVLAAAPAHGQFYFGKNKVQYTSFDWQVMTTEHFRVYFYKEEAEIAQVAARIAEDAYRPMAARFNHEVKRKIPLIIYSSPSLFAQTNVIPGLLPESVAGVTEFLKGRVVVPFHGSYHDFKHVITHELVHVFTISKLESLIDRQSSPRHAFPPLWFTEGLAEHWSEEWDTEADMILRDMVINGRLYSIMDLWKIRGTYFMYKLGQSVCKFISDEYGPDKLTLIFENWLKGRNFDEVVRWTLGENLEEISEKWEYSLKKRYYPELEDLGLPAMESKQLTYDGYSLKGVPITWDDGHGSRDWIVFMAYRLGYTGIYMKPRQDNGDGLRTLVKGERSSKFESLHLLRSGIDATNSGLVVFSSKSKEQDIIYVYDLARMNVTGEYRFEELVAVRSPRLSPDEKKLVFTGIHKSGHSDLYLLDLASGDYETVTGDVYYDVDPTFSSDGNSIVFASDRCADGQAGATNLFELDLYGAGDIRQLTSGNFKDQAPEFTEQGIYFSSDREGSCNLFLLDHNGDITRQSTYVTGAFDPQLSPDGTRLIYSGYQDLRFQVYSMELTEHPKPVASFAAAASSWTPAGIDAEFSRTSMRYDTEYSFDIAQSMINYDPVYGSIGGLQASVSDILGNHAFYFLLTNTAETKDELLQSFNFGVTYVNKEKQLNWGVGAFHLYDEYFNDVDQYFFERQAGVIGLFSYPFSKFQRLDQANFARYDKKDRRFGLPDREGFLLTNYLSWVYDNSVWDISGPIEGRRYNVSVGITHSVDKARNWNRLAFADIRHYIRLGAYSAFANRLFAYTSTGLEPQRIYFGGSWSFRGYDRRRFYNRNILFASNELRFPLIDALVIGFPIGGVNFRGIRGALFFDVGSAWDDSFDQFLGSFGGGFRVSLGYLVLLRFDFTRTTDFETISPSFDFDFFFGWNF